jgi:hypothetical protein
MYLDGKENLSLIDSILRENEWISYSTYIEAKCSKVMIIYVYHSRFRDISIDLYPLTIEMIDRLDAIKQNLLPSRLQKVSHYRPDIDVTKTKMH